MPHADHENEWSTCMRAALAGDSGAYRRILQQITPHLRAVARQNCARFGAPTVDAEDAVQEALLAIHLKRSTWDPSRPITPWISVIVRNKLIDVLRRSGQPGVPIDDLIDVLPAVDSSAHSHTRDLRRLISKLKGRQRAVIEAISVEGCTAREAAVRLGMSETNVRVSLHRALKALAALYQGNAG